ncbi:MAG: ATP-binding cassette domain-containing protein, partial [bacterium]
SDTVYNNVKYSKENASYEDIVDACIKAGVHEDIISKDKGYDFVIMEDGKGLSGGQRQRIALARTFLKNSPIIILDEPTSSLDPATSKYITQKVFEYFKNKTIIFISHDYEIVKLVDKVFVVENSKVLEKSFEKN